MEVHIPWIIWNLRLLNSTKLTYLRPTMKIAASIGRRISKTVPIGLRNWKVIDIMIKIGIAHITVIFCYHPGIYGIPCACLATGGKYHACSASITCFRPRKLAASQVCCVTNKSQWHGFGSLSKAQDLLDNQQHLSLVCLWEGGGKEVKITTPHVPGVWSSSKSRAGIDDSAWSSHHSTPWRFFVSPNTLLTSSRS